MSSTAVAWSGRRVTEARAYVETRLPLPCTICGQEVKPGDRFALAHIEPRWKRPDLTWEPSNWGADHKRCSDASGQANVIAKARAGAGFSHDEGVGKPPPLPGHTYSQPELREALSWHVIMRKPPAWLRPFKRVPAEAACPLAMTPPHPEAVGSYGAEAIEWVEHELGITLRWWQRLAFVRQLEHRADGSLCWRTIVESCPRRAGKSVRLRSMALWRLDHADQFGEPQLALHTGKDVAIVREIHRQAWRWAQTRDGWDVKRGVGQEEVYLGDNRWLVRSTDSVYGYDVCLGMIDEAWAVTPATFDEGLEPATMERHSPQLLLTSTAHRRATSLMRKQVSSALAAEDGETLLLLWAAPPDSDHGDPATWKAASPHWSEDRRRMIAAKYEKALAGEVDPEADDLDPMEGFKAQYLNIWRLRPRERAKRGDPIVTEEAWASLEATVPFEAPDAAAIESWFADGTSLALAWRADDGLAVVSTSDHPSMAEAVEALRESGFTGQVSVGKSLADDPALRGIRVKPMQMRTAAVAQSVERLVTDGVLAHDGGDHLTEQVLALRVLPGSDGPRMISQHRADAVKAALWAAERARARSGKPRVLVPRGRRTS